jgi:hypothetical protein
MINYGWVNVFVGIKVEIIQKENAHGTRNCEMNEVNE